MAIETGWISNPLAPTTYRIVGILSGTVYAETTSAEAVRVALQVVTMFTTGIASPRVTALKVQKAQRAVEWVDDDSWQ